MYSCKFSPRALPSVCIQSRTENLKSANRVQAPSRGLGREKARSQSLVSAASCTHTHKRARFLTAGRHTDRSEVVSTPTIRLFQRTPIFSYSLSSSSSLPPPLPYSSAFWGLPLPHTNQRNHHNTFNTVPSHISAAADDDDAVGIMYIRGI